MSIDRQKVAQVTTLRYHLLETRQNSSGGLSKLMASSRMQSSSSVGRPSIFACIGADSPWFNIRWLTSDVTEMPLSESDQSVRLDARGGRVQDGFFNPNTYVQTHRNGIKVEMEIIHNRWHSNACARWSNSHLLSRVHLRRSVLEKNGTSDR